MQLQGPYVDFSWSRRHSSTFSVGKFLFNNRDTKRTSEHFCSISFSLILRTGISLQRWSMYLPAG